MKDGWFLTKHDEICFMNYAYYQNKDIIISVSIIKEKHDFFSTPLSSSKLDIYASHGLLENNKCIPNFKNALASTNLDNIKCKCFALFYKKQFVFLPLLHTFDTNIM